MRDRPVVSALLDVAAGLGAIVVVVGSCIASDRVGLDFRAQFAVTGSAFFLAGISRGSPHRKKSAWRIIRIGAPGLLGTAALILNNGPHRLAMPIGLIVIAVFGVAAGIAVRGMWAIDRRRSMLSGLGTLAAMAAVCVLAIPGLSAYSAFDSSRRPAPSFDLDLDSGKLTSSQLRGHVVVLSFWTSWCAQCIQELPQIQRLYERYQGDSRVMVYAVDLGWDGETPDAGKACLARHRIKIPLAFNAGDAAQSLHIDAIPAIVLVDSSGTVRFTHNGYDVSENMEAGLEAHINELLAGH